MLEEILKDRPFIGRSKELALLNDCCEIPIARLIVISGRRRIGKSRLIEEFGKQFSKVYILSGVAPSEKTTRLEQIHDFGIQLGKVLGEPRVEGDDWNDQFYRLAQATRKGRVLILLDEISWMGSEDHNFLGKLKNAWDLEFKKNPQLVLVLCGSVSTWIEKNIINGTGFFGRISLSLTIGELPLIDCAKFWGNQSSLIAAYEKFKVLAVAGGVPRYLEELKPRFSAEENIRRMCLLPSGLLFKEYDQIFSAVFSSRSELYRGIVQCILDGNVTYEDIYAKLGVEKSGTISEYLEDLIKSGFVQRDFTWSLKTGKVSKFSRFRISDNYLRFYLKYILPNKDKIVRDEFADMSLALLPGFDGIMALQFENLVLNNRKAVRELLGIRPGEVVYDNPYFQNKTTLQEGCQIDYLIQTRFNSLYVCEIKFSRKPVGVEVIDEVEQKIKRLKSTRSFSKRPVLIHVNGVDEDVLVRDYFSHIIDFSQLLAEAAPV